MAASNLGADSFPASKLKSWRNGVQVTINIPCEAALRLQELAVHGEVINELGILSVRIEDQVPTLSLNNHLDESQEVALKIPEIKNANVSRSDNFDLSAVSSCSFGPNIVETTRKNIAHYLSQQGSNLASSAVSSASLGGVGSPFAPPKVLSADIPNGFRKRVLDTDHHIKLHSPSPLALKNGKPQVVQSPEFCHLPHDHTARPCSPQMNFSPFTGLNQVINTKYASSHHQPVVQAHGYSSRFNFSPPPSQISPFSHEPALSCLEPSAYVNVFDRTESSHSLHTPEIQKTCSPNKSLNMPFTSFCPQISNQNQVVPMSQSSSQGNVALSSPMLVNLLKNEAGNNANKMMPPPLLPSKQIQKRRRRARKSKDMPHANMVVSPSASFASPDKSPGLCPSKPSISNLHTSPSPDFDAYNSEAFHHTLHRIPFSTLSTPLSQASKIHPWTEEYSEVLDNKLPHQRQIPLEALPVTRLPSGMSFSNNCNTSSYSSAFESCKDKLTMTESESSLCCPEKNQTYDKNKPFTSPHTDTKIKHLINPFTGQLEPMPSEDDDEYSFNSSDFYSEFYVGATNNACSDNNIINNSNSLSGKNMKMSACNTVQLSSKSQNFELKVAGTNCFSDSRVKGSLKSDYTPETSTFLVGSSPDEKLKSRLTVDSKIDKDFIGENIEKSPLVLDPYPSHGIDGIETNIKPQNKSSKNTQCSSENMQTCSMQRRHSSSNDLHTVVAKYPKKNHFRKRSFDSASKLFNSLKQPDMLNSDSHVEKNLSQNYISRNLPSPLLSPNREDTTRQTSEGMNFDGFKNIDIICTDQKMHHDNKMRFRGSAYNSGLRFSPTKDMQNAEFSRSFNVLSSVNSKTLNNCNSNTDTSVVFASSQEKCKPELFSLLDDKYKLKGNEVPPLCVQKSLEMIQGVCSVQSEESAASALTSDMSVCVADSEMTDIHLQQIIYNVLPKGSHLSSFTDSVMKDCVKAEKCSSPTSETVFSILDSSVHGKSAHEKTEISNISVRNLCSKLNPEEKIEEGGSENVTSVTQDMQNINTLPHLLVEEPLQSSTEDGTSFELQGCNSSSPKSVNSIPPVLCDTSDSYPALTCSLTEHDVLPSVASDANETTLLGETQVNIEEETKSDDASSPCDDIERITSQHHFETPPDSRSPVSLSDKGINEEISTLDLDKPKITNSAPGDKNCCKSINEALRKLSFQSENSSNENCPYSLAETENIENVKINQHNSFSNSTFELSSSTIEQRSKEHYINISRTQGVKKETSDNGNSNEILDVMNAKSTCSDKLKDISIPIDNMHNSFHIKSSEHAMPVASQKNQNDFLLKTESQCKHQIEDDISVDIKDIDLFQDFKKINFSEEMTSPVAKIISLPLQNIPHMIEVPSLHATQSVPKIKCAKIESLFETSSIPSLIPSHGNSFSNLTVPAHQYKVEHEVTEPVTIHSRFISSSHLKLEPLLSVKKNVCNIGNSESGKVLNDGKNHIKNEERKYGSVKQECDSTISSDESSLDSLDNLNENNLFPLSTCNAVDRSSKNDLDSKHKKLSCYNETDVGMQNEKNVKLLTHLNESEISSNVMCEKDVSLSKNITVSPALNPDSHPCSELEGCVQMIADSSSSSEHQSTGRIINTDVTCNTSSSSYSNKLSPSLNNMDCSSMVQQNSFSAQEATSILNKNETFVKINAKKLLPFPKMADTNQLSVNHSTKISPDIITDSLENNSSAGVISELKELPKCNTELLWTSSSQTNHSPGTDSSQIECISTYSKPLASSANQTKDELESSSSTNEELSLSNNSMLHNNVEQTKLPPSLTLAKTPTCVRITPEISGGNKVRLILKGSLNMTNQSASSSSVVVPFNNSKGVPIKFVTLPGKSSALSVRSTANPSVVEIIGSTSTSRISNNSSPVRLVVSKVPSGKSNTTTMVVKSVVVNGTTASIKLVPSNDPLVSTTSAALLTRSSQSSISSEVVKTSTSAFVEKQNEVYVSNSEIRSDSFECSAPNANLLKSNKNSSLEDSDKYKLSLSLNSDCNKLDTVTLKKENNNSDFANCLLSSDKDISAVSSSKDNIVTNSEVLPISKEYELLSNEEVTSCLDKDCHNAENTCRNNNLFSDFSCKDSKIKPFIEAEINKNNHNNENSACIVETYESEVSSSEKSKQDTFPAEMSSKLNSTELGVSRMKPVRPSFDKCDNEVRTIHLVDCGNSKQSTVSGICNERLNSDISLVVKTKCSESGIDAVKVSKEELKYAQIDLEEKKGFTEDQYKGATGKQQVLSCKW